MGNVWSAAGLQAKFLPWGVGLLKCIRPVCGAELLAIMEFARRWSIKWVELEGSYSHAGLGNAGCDRLTDAQRRSAESEAFSQLSKHLEENQNQYGIIN